MKAKFIRTQDKNLIIQCSHIQGFYIEQDWETNKFVVVANISDLNMIYFGAYKEKETAQLILVKVLNYMANNDKDASVIFDVPKDDEMPYLPDNLTSKEAERIIDEFSVEVSAKAYNYDDEY